jgi:hypothetical protein
MDNDELKVTLQMLDIKYTFVGGDNSLYLGLKQFEKNSELKEILFNILNKYNYCYNDVISTECISRKKSIVGLSIYLK